MYDYIPSLVASSVPVLMQVDSRTAALALQAVPASLFMSLLFSVSVGRFYRGCGFRHILPWGENRFK